MLITGEDTSIIEKSQIEGDWQTIECQGLYLMQKLVRTFGRECDIALKQLKNTTEGVYYGHIRAITHQTLPLILFNYTDEASFTGAWTPGERVSRGLIINYETGEVVAHPFNKFFNLGQMPESSLDDLGIFEATDKLDGSMVSVFRMTQIGPLLTATRGSFASNQAIWASHHLAANYPKLASDMPAGLTLIFEVIYPGNEGPLLSYGDTESMTLIGARNQDGLDLSYHKLVSLSGGFGLNLVKSCEIKSSSDLQGLKETAKGVEGWVIRLPSGLRVKVKTDEYLKILRLVNHLTPRRVRDVLLNSSKNGPALQELVQELPDEFKDEILGMAAKLIKKVVEMQDEVNEVLQLALISQRESNQTGLFNSRPKFAEFVKRNKEKLAPYLFKSYDGYNQEQLFDFILSRLDLKQVLDEGVIDG